MFRFSTKSIFITTALIAIGAAWFLDHSRLKGKLAVARQTDHPVTYYGEKHNLWSPSLLLSSGTNPLENFLNIPPNSLTGPLITSKQGVSRETLRQPTFATVDRVINLLDDRKKSKRNAAACLLALYLESVSGRENEDYPSLRLRGYIHANVMKHIEPLLESPDPKLRSAGALIAGNLFFNKEIDQLVKGTFDRESDANVKLRLAWAYHHLTD